MLINDKHLTLLQSSVRRIRAKVELFNSSTLVNTFNDTDRLISFDIERVGVGKFFGFGFCQRASIKLLDVNRELDITTANSFKILFDDVTPYPEFYVTEVNRDENTNEITITAYDLINKTREITFADLGLQAPYSIADVSTAIASYFGLELELVNLDGDNRFSLSYENGANFEGTETLLEVLTAIAEATLTIFYINNNKKLVFKRLDKDGEPVITITRADYITLNSKTNRRLVGICNATELGDNVIATLDVAGTTQYINNNPFYELRDDIEDIVNTALGIVGGFTINQFDMSYRGNYLLEIGDKVNLVTKDGDTVTSYVLNSKISYNGALSESMSWQYEDGENAGGNPTTLGEALKLTYAKVDKANAEISIVAGEASSIKLTTNGIQQTVSKLDNDIADVTREVNTKVSAEDVNFSIQSAMSDGVDKVTTITGFTFNEEGLHISKTDSEITTSITEDGMQIYKNNDVVLTADNEGVKAEDLHATTYLIIGTNSRIEDYGNNRTGCFWIGG